MKIRRRTFLATIFAAAVAALTGKPTKALALLEGPHGGVAWRAIRRVAILNDGWVARIQSSQADYNRHRSEPLRSVDFFRGQKWPAGVVKFWRYPKLPPLTINRIKK